MAPTNLATRRAAVRLICAVTEEQRLLSDLLPQLLADLPPAGRARAQHWAQETLRWMDRADRLLGPHLSRMPPPPVMNALRMALVEMAVDGSPAHAVVDTTVALVKSDRATRRMAGLVNAVLRRADLSRWDALPLPRLPKRLRAALVRAWGKASVEAMEAAHAKGAPLDLTPRDDDAEAIANRLSGEVLPTGSVRLRGRVQVSALPGYDTGAWWVQDAAAALPARILAPRPGERIADLCAAPGGKTLQLAAAGADVVALDRSPARLARLRENLARTRLSAEIVEADLIGWNRDGFDAVLLDPPCSATGTIRRHPDLPHAKADWELADLTALQSAMLDHAARCLGPGGRLVYCTCSLFPEEGEDQIARFLERQDSLRPDPAAFDIPGIDPAWRVPTGLRIRPDFWPDRNGLDGFFVAALRKSA